MRLASASSASSLMLSISQVQLGDDWERAAVLISSNIAKNKVYNDSVDGPIAKPLDRSRNNIRPVFDLHLSGRVEYHWMPRTECQKAISLAV
ncbi:hypothetical protein [Agrobacterium sp. NPDC090283]|uniref:hypothetical protein n=1 Tax=Agrobacterium sp. NPDC090283 TaxID=3363920 RepID=UPI00383A23D9